MLHFSYEAYRQLVLLLREHNYNLTDYYQYKGVFCDMILIIHWNGHFNLLKWKKR